MLALGQNAWIFEETDQKPPLRPLQPLQASKEEDLTYQSLLWMADS